MDLTLQITTGEDAGRRITIAPSAGMVVGRGAEADVRVNGDPLMSAKHFAVDRSAGSDVVRDLGSRFGTTVNGLKIAEAPIGDGDVIGAGRTSFSVRGGGPSAGQTTAVTPAPIAQPLTVTPGPATVPLASFDAPEQRELSAKHRAIVAYLRKVPGTLFGLFDAAREPSVIGRMERAGHEFQCLYDGQKGDDFSAFGPWLVHLPKTSPFVDELVSEGWGHSWGVYIAAEKPFAEVRRHLRKFLIVKLPDGREVFFRFYDPRVLRTYLPTCTEEEVANFVGPLTTFVVESIDEGELLEFAGRYKNWERVGVGS